MSPSVRRKGLQYSSALVPLSWILGVPVAPALDHRAVDHSRPTPACFEDRRPSPPGGYPVLPGIFRLHGTDSDLPLDDMEPLREVIGDASFVGLGESVHTSGGYYEMKHRILRFLVERMGFRVLAFESNWDTAESVERYLQTCDGSAEAATRGLFGVWQSAEVRDLVRWMCEWNRVHHQPKDRLHFYGFDIQQPKDDGPALIEFLERIGLAADDPRILAIGKCDGVVRFSYPAPVPALNHWTCLDALATVENLFVEEEERIVRLTSRRDLEWAKLRRFGLQAWEDEAYYRTSNPPRSFEARDSAMAFMLEAVRDIRYRGDPRTGGDPRTVVWAHNVHLSKAAPEYYYATTMGTFLDQTLGDAYVALGLVAFEVRIDWLPLCGGFLVRHDDSVEQLFHELGHDHLLVDLDFPGGSPPFIAPNAPYRVGSQFMVPRRQFDGLVYSRRSHAMTPLAWPPCGQPRSIENESDPLLPNRDLGRE